MLQRGTQVLLGTLRHNTLFEIALDGHVVFTRRFVFREEALAETAHWRWEFVKHGWHV